MNKLNKSGEIPQPYFDPKWLSVMVELIVISLVCINTPILQYRQKVLILPSAFPVQTEVALSVNKKRFKIT